MPTTTTRLKCATFCSAGSVYINIFVSPLPLYLLVVMASASWAVGYFFVAR